MRAHDVTRTNHWAIYNWSYIFLSLIQIAFYNFHISFNFHIYMVMYCPGCGSEHSSVEEMFWGNCSSEWDANQVLKVYLLQTWADLTPQNRHAKIIIPVILHMVHAHVYKHPPSRHWTFCILQWSNSPFQFKKRISNALPSTTKWSSNAPF